MPELRQVKPGPHGARARCKKRWPRRLRPQQLGLWQQLTVDAPATLREAKVLEGNGKAALLNFTSSGTGLEDLAWLVPNHLIREAARQVACTRPQVSVLSDAHRSRPSHCSRMQVW